MQRLGLHSPHVVLATPFQQLPSTLLSHSMPLAGDRPHFVDALTCRSNAHALRAPDRLAPDLIIARIDRLALSTHGTAGSVHPWRHDSRC